MKMLAVDDNTHKRWKILSANTGKMLNELIIEATDLIERKYQENQNEQPRSEPDN